MKLIATLALMCVVAPFQARPDFNGRWIAVAPEELAGQRLFVTLTPTTVKLHHFLSNEEYVAEYGLDGQPRVAPAKYSPGGRLLLSAKWEDAQLVLIDMVNSQAPQRIQRTLSFDKNGDLVLAQRSPRPSPDILVGEEPFKHSDRILEPTRIVFRRLP